MNRDEVTTARRDRGDDPGPADPARRERRWETIEAKLHAAEYWLSHQGSLVCKRIDGHTCWVVRFVVREGERSTHRSIYLTTHDPEILRRTRTLLDHYRRQGDEIRRFMRLISGACRSPRTAHRSR